MLNLGTDKYIICRSGNRLYYPIFHGEEYAFLAFHTAEQRNLFIEENMQLVKDYDYVLRPYENYSLDYVGERAVKANKVKYSEHGLNELLKNDPKKYYFYNAIDSLIVMLIRHRLKCIESPAAVASLTLIPLLKAFGQVAVTTANLFNIFYDDGKHVDS